MPESPTTPQVARRMERWKQQLLDLSLRNHLLNLRDGLQAIQLHGASLHEVEDRLQNGVTFSLDALENLLGAEEFQNAEKLSVAEREKIYADAIAKAKKADALYSVRPAKELSRKLLELMRKGRLDQEEGDVHTIFATFGVLAWKPKGDKIKRYAPLVLEPVTLNRKSIQAGFTIMRHDDETLFNQTLVELLKRDFQIKLPSMDELPADDHGVDLNAVFTTVREAVAAIPECEILETLYVARLSFSKFLMWNDLNNRAEALEKQPLVHHLVQGLSGLYDDQIKVFPPAEVESHLELENLCCPLAADASQLTAILYSALGKTFVLHGPPGTGKSQSIANLICHNLTLGRRVLFVSEKKAALEVVQNRLNKLGMRPFCLELHSNKTGKAEVLAQFREALNLATAAEPQNWQTLVKDLATQRDALNGYIRLLHHAYPNGISAFQCLAETLEEESSAQINWKQDDLLTQTAEQRGQLENALKSAQDGFAAVTPQLCHAMRLFAQPLDWTKLNNSQLPPALATVQKALDSLRNAIRQLDDAFGFMESPTGEEALAARDLLASKLPELKTLPRPLLANDVADHLDDLLTTLDHAKRLVELRGQLAQWHPMRLTEVPVASALQTLTDNNARFFLMRFFANRSLGKSLMGFRQITAPRPGADELAHDLPLISEYQSLVQNHASDFRHLGGLLDNPQWLEGATPNWQALAAQLETAALLVHAILELFGPQPDTRLATLPECMDTALPAAEAYRQALKRFNDALHAFQQIAAMTNAPVVDDSLNALDEMIADALENLDSLRPYRVWRQSRENAEAAGLSPFLDALETGTFPPAELLTVFRRKLEAVMLQQILAAEPVLADFIGTRHEHRIEQFCKLDADYMALSAKLAVARISARLPQRRNSECPAGTALGFLKRECEKKARIKPVRTILQNVAPILGSLKPCFLMSPLSVAQYLPPDMSQFDLVVFDEASQIPTADAIGAIARGKQFICVGDQKQMPPTQFFQKTNTDTVEEDDEVEELDSILDECLTAGVHSCHLNWHYRSRHESLIAFSNQHYYDNQLNTFPAAANSPLLGVHFQFVPNAVLERKSRTNSAEADAIVAYVAAMIADPAQAKRSVGIVTFNIAQCELIQDRFEQFRSEHPQFEAYFSDSLPEPFFVKNLENVQGDERDVILFSVGYAPDADGKLYMNFGPLNRVGGERRLNVAITRAKHRVVVFSSIHASQIDLSRTGAKGANDLREFLAYAEHGAAATAPELVDDQAADTLQDTIARFLAEQGYETDRNVGCSSFRIDLAVKDATKPGSYLLGILCDGKRSARDYTCRDRESTRTGVLKGLGWHLAHAWSTEWRLDRPAAERALLEALDTAANGREPREKTTSSTSTTSSPPSSTSTTSQPSTTSSTSTTSQPSTTSTTSQSSTISTTSSPPSPASQSSQYHPWQGKTKCPLNEFGLTLRCHQELVRQVREIIAAEGPITNALLARRLRTAWNITRNTSKVQDTILSAIEVAFPRNTTDAAGEKIFWPVNANPQDYQVFRVPATPEERRDFTEIPDIEIRNAAASVRYDFPDANDDIVAKETTRLFGFPSCTPALRKRFDQAVLAG